MTGKVYLVGAGPGDPGLITVKGARLLESADVVVYDRLANPELLDYCAADAEFVYVGKAPQKHRYSQAEINRLLVARGLAGRRVVRLKGGDPFVFGRGGEEALALRWAGVPFEIVPGISSALAVPAYAGIPVTQRHTAAMFTVVTGHRADAADPATIPWEDLPDQGTLVILMGVSQMETLTDRLIAGGWSAATPAAVIESGTLPDQRKVVAPLGGIASAAREAEIRPPAIIVIGEVVTLESDLDWFSGWTPDLKRGWETQSFDLAMAQR